MSFARTFAATFVASVAVQATAAPAMLYPVQSGAETIRFQKGVPTLNLETQSGSMQITPLPFDHGHVTVGIAVYNKGSRPANFGIENITATIDGRPVAVLSSSELQKRAKSRAMWSQIGIAVLAGAAAGIASQAYTTNSYSGYARTPHGTYSWASSYRDNSLGVLGATAAVAGGTAGIVGIQNRLDYTLANLAEEIIQTTTVDPDASYGGQVVVEKDPKAKMPYDVRISMSLNGTDYPFVFRVTAEGTNLPAPYVMAAVVPYADLPTPVETSNNSVAPTGLTQTSAPPSIKVAPVGVSTENPPVIFIKSMPPTIQ